MCVRSFEPLARKIVQVLMVLSREPVEGDGLVGAGLGVFANMAILVKYALATRLLPITVKALFDAWPAFAEVEGLFEGFDLVFVEFSRGIVRFFQALVCLSSSTSSVQLSGSTSMVIAGVSSFS
jgi:hypothetical protein